MPVPEPSKIDISRPSSARVWNYLLGGKDNYPADRNVGDALEAQLPGIREVARQGRRFLARAVTHLAHEGVDQFLDIGTGLPTMENTHEVAQRVDPRARVVYVDNDDHVLAHANALLRGSPLGQTWYVKADVRDPESVLVHARALLDLERPVAVLMLGILGHAVPDFDDVVAVLGTLTAALSSGSYLVLLDGTDTSDGARAAAPMNNYTLRTLDEFRKSLDGLELLEPGVVPTSQWRPDGDPAPASADPLDSYCAVARKP